VVLGATELVEKCRKILLCELEDLNKVNMTHEY
jgi:hypothetical protein